MKDQVTYLNAGETPDLKPQLAAAIAGLPAKIQTMPAAQWIQAIQSLPGKGQVRASELEDSKVITWLKEQGKGKLSREEVIQHVMATAVTVKEVCLGRPEYSGWTHAKHFPGSRYEEVLFIACSEKMLMEDSLEEIEWQIEQFNFEPALLVENPERLFELEGQRKKLVAAVPMAHEYHAPHFSGKDQFGERYAKNLFAHARVVIAPEQGLFLIDEVQSDWAQRGRGCDWNGVPRGAFVTDTKVWAGLVLRRLLQRAAQTPGIQRVAWIRSGLHNGGLSVTPGKNHDDFYMEILKGIADKAIKPHGGQVRVQSLQIGAHLVPDLCQIEMSDQLRHGLAAAQPLYSRAQLVPRFAIDESAERGNWDGLAVTARKMLGSRVHLQLLDRVYDVAAGTQVAGTMANHQIMVSLRAADKDFVINHECWHYAHEYLLTPAERAVVEAEFRWGSIANQQVRQILLERGDVQAARQCSDAKEAAAYGFALFVRGELDVRSPDARGWFAQVWQAFRDVAAWIRSSASHRMEATELYDIFEGVRRGDYSPDRAEEAEQHREWCAPASK